MPRFLRYEDALAWMRGRTRLSAEDLVRGLNATLPVARSFLQRMESDGLIGPLGPDGACPVLGERRRRWSAEASAASDPWAELARFRAELDTQTRRAEAAEALLARHAASRERLAALRHMLAWELHPDTAAPVDDPVLQAGYAELFKRVWPGIEHVLDGADEK